MDCTYVILSERVCCWLVCGHGCLAPCPGEHRASLKATVRIHPSNSLHRVHDGNGAGGPLASLPSLDSPTGKCPPLRTFPEPCFSFLHPHWEGSCSDGGIFFRLGCPGKNQMKSASMFSTPVAAALRPPLRIFLSCSVLVSADIVSPPTYPFRVKCLLSKLRKGSVF